MTFNAEQLNAKSISESLEAALTVIDKVDLEPVLTLDALNHVCRLLQGIKELEKVFELESILETSHVLCGWTESRNSCKRLSVLEILCPTFRWVTEVA